MQIIFIGHSMADGATLVGPNGVGIALILQRLEIAHLFTVWVVSRVEGMLLTMA